MAADTRTTVVCGPQDLKDANEYIAKYQLHNVTRLIAALVLAVYVPHILTRALCVLVALPLLNCRNGSKVSDVPTSCGGIQNSNQPQQMEPSSSQYLSVNTKKNRNTWYATISTHRAEVKPEHHTKQDGAIGRAQCPVHDIHPRKSCTSVTNSWFGVEDIVNNGGSLRTVDPAEVRPQIATNATVTTQESSKPTHELKSTAFSLEELSADTLPLADCVPTMNKAGFMANAPLSNTSQPTDSNTTFLRAANDGTMTKTKKNARKKERLKTAATKRLYGSALQSQEVKETYAGTTTTTQQTRKLLERLKTPQRNVEKMISDPSSSQGPSSVTSDYSSVDRPDRSNTKPRLKTIPTAVAPSYQAPVTENKPESRGDRNRNSTAEHMVADNTGLTAAILDAYMERQERDYKTRESRKTPRAMRPDERLISEISPAESHGLLAYDNPCNLDIAPCLENKAPIPPANILRDNSIDRGKAKEQSNAQASSNAAVMAEVPRTLSSERPVRQFEVPGFLHGTLVAAVPDYGSSFDIISEELALNLKLSVDSSTTKSFYLPNGLTRAFIGTVRLAWSFLDEDPCYERVFHVLKKCVHPVMLGRQFLELTETMSTNAHRIRVSVMNYASKLPRRLCFVDGFGKGDETSRRRFLGLVNGRPIGAFADTQSDLTIINRPTAKRLGLPMLEGPGNITEVQFIDGTTAFTTGIIRNVNWCFSVSLAPQDMRLVDIHVMDNLPCALILDKWLLHDNKAFIEYEDTIIDIAVQNARAWDGVCMIMEKRPRKLWNMTKKLFNGFSDTDGASQSTPSSDNTLWLDEIHARGSAMDRIAKLFIAERAVAQRIEDQRILSWDAAHPDIIPGTSAGPATVSSVINSSAQTSGPPIVTGSNATSTRQLVPTTKRRGFKRSNTSRTSAKISNRNGCPI